MVTPTSNSAQFRRGSACRTYDLSPNPYPNQVFFAFEDFSLAKYGVAVSTDGGARFDDFQQLQTLMGATKSAKATLFDNNVKLVGGYDILRSPASTWSWSKKYTGNREINGFASNGVVYIAGTNSGRILRSIDLGENWSEVSSFNNPLAALNENINVVCYDPTRGRFYAFGTYGRMVMSEDGGATWVIQAVLLDTSYGSSQIEAAAVDGETGDILCIGDGFVYRSSDGGVTWNNPPSEAQLAYNAYSVIRHNGLWVAVIRPYSGSGYSVVTSPDGVAWTVRKNTAINQPYDLVPMTADPRLGTSSSTSSGDLGVDTSSSSSSSKSSASESSSSSRDLPMWLMFGVSTYGIFKSDRLFASNQQKLAWSSYPGGGFDIRNAAISTDKEGVVVAIGYTGKVLRSVDGGNNWSQPSAAPASASYRNITYSKGRFVATADSTTTVAYSNDDGNTWAAGSGGTGNFLAVPKSNGNGVWLCPSATYNNLKYSTDNGSTWLVFSHALNKYSRSVCPIGGNEFLVGFTDGRIYKATWSGVSWSFGASLSATDGNPVVDFVHLGGQSFLAFTYDNYNVESWKTTNGGTSWSYVGVTSGDGYYASLKQVAYQDGVVAVVYGRGVYISTDDGATWELKQPFAAAFTYDDYLAVTPVNPNVIPGTSSSTSADVADNTSSSSSGDLAADTSSSSKSSSSTPSPTTQTISSSTSSTSSTESSVSSQSPSSASLSSASPQTASSVSPQTASTASTRSSLSSSSRSSPTSNSSSSSSSSSNSSSSTSSSRSPSSQSFASTSSSRGTRSPTSLSNSSRSMSTASLSTDSSRSESSRSSASTLGTRSLATESSSSSSVDEQSSLSSVPSSFSSASESS